MEPQGVADGVLAPIIDVSRETLDQLRDFQTLILKWTQRINLISRNTTDEIWQRHIVDSAQLFPLAGEDWRQWIDLGSGGGFPGLVIAILASEKNPNGKIHLVESDVRKCVFLEMVTRELGLPVAIHNDRIEKIDTFSADVVSARALASVSDLLEMARPFSGAETRLLLLKGSHLDSELTQADGRWHIDADKIPSLTDPSARILSVRHFRERS